jgi:hypothetical protein
MPKLYEYFGLRVFFYANEHEPVHVHGFYHRERKKFRKFAIENGFLHWNDFDLVFPMADLYKGWNDSVMERSIRP